MECCNKFADVPPTRRRRLLDLGKWTAPGAVLLLIPKCPLCVAAYVTGITGMGISVSAAGSLRFGAIAACGVALAWLVSKGLYERIS